MTEEKNNKRFDSEEIIKIYDLLYKQANVNRRFDNMFESQVKLNDNILNNQKTIIFFLESLEERISKLEKGGELNE